MAIEPITQMSGQMQQGQSDGFDIPAPSGMPDTTNMSQDDIAGLLRQAQTGGSQGEQSPVTPPVADDPLNQGGVNQPEQKPPEVKPAVDQVKDPLAKFKNADGTLNTDNLSKSYLEAEKNLSQHFQIRSEAERLRQENEQLMQMAEELQERIDAGVQPQQTQQGPAPMTQQDIDEYNANPAAFVARKANEAISAKINESSRQAERNRIQDFKVLSAVNKAERELPGFDIMRPEVEKILKSDFIDYHPGAVPMAYNAAIGAKLPQIVAQVKNAAFTEGYEKAKSEFARGVDSGRSTVPVEGSGFTEDQIQGLTLEEHAKLIPNHGV